MRDREIISILVIGKVELTLTRGKENGCGCFGERSGFGFGMC